MSLSLMAQMNYCVRVATTNFADRYDQMTHQAKKRMSQAGAYNALMRPIISAFALALLLVGCTTIRYDYYPPSSDQGRFCITQCAGVREMCQGNEIQRAQYDQALCERRSESMYRACLRHADSKDEAKRCYRQSCFSHENTWRCDEDYRQCFVNCGGAIQVIEEE